MKHDGTQLFQQVIDGDWPGFTRVEDGGVITLTHQETGARIQAKTTAKGRYMVHKIGSADKPLSFGAQLGNGTLKTNIQARLSRWGLETREGRLQQAEAKARQEEADKHEPPEETTDTDTTPEEEVTRAADEILADVPFSIELIAAHVLDLAKADSTARRFEERGVICYDWRGDLYKVLCHLWPGLPEIPNPDDIKRLYVSLIPPMRQSGALRQVKDEGQQTVWRVRDIESKPAALIEASPTPPAAVQEPTPVPAPTQPAAAPDVPPGPTTPEETEELIIHQCPDCVFADQSQYAVQMHVNKFAKRPEKHPRGSAGFPCPEGCGSVRTEPYALRKHCVEGHPEKYDTTQVMCQKADCLQWFDNISLYRDHLKTAHPDALRRPDNRVPAPEPVAVQEEPVSATPARATPSAPFVVQEAAPAARRVPATVNGNGAAAPEETPAEAAIRMLTEYPHQQTIIEDLREANARLHQEVEELRVQIRDRDRTLKGFRKKLDALFSE